MPHVEPSPVRSAGSARIRRRLPVIAALLALSPLLWWTWGRVAISRWPPWVPRLGEMSPPLPAYGIELSRPPGHEERGGRQAQVRLRYDEVLTVAVKPSEKVAGAVEIKSFLEHEGECRPWAVSFEIGGAGLFLLNAPVQSLPGLAPQGVWRIIVLVARPGRMPPDPEAAHRMGPSPDWTRLDGLIEIEPPDAGVPAEEM